MINVQSSSASKPSPSNELILGEVKFNGRTYVAILHYHAEDSSELPITENMKEVQKTFCSKLQKILDIVDKTTSLSIPLERVSSGGFIFATDNGNTPSFSHETLKTQMEWRKFLILLANPELAPYMENEIEFIDTTDLTQEKQEKLIEAIIQKFKKVSSKENKVNLEKEEKKLLQLLHLQQLSQGIRDEQELASLVFLKRRRS